MSIQSDWKKQPMKALRLEVLREAFEAARLVREKTKVNKPKKGCSVARMKRTITSARFGIVLRKDRVYEIAHCAYTGEPDERITLRVHGPVCMMVLRKYTEHL